MLPGLPMGFHDPLQLWQAASRLVEQALAGLPAWPGPWAAAPPVTVEEAAGELVVRAPVGSIDPSSLEVQVGPQWIYLAGSQRQEYRHEQPGQVLAAAAWGRFATAVPLPAPVDPTRARAELADGVLVVRVPRV